MPSPHPAVTPSAIAIARSYGPSVSKGIIMMKERVDLLTSEGIKEFEKNERLLKESAVLKVDIRLLQEENKAMKEIIEQQKEEISSMSKIGGHW
jgi:hypothetical protein